MSPLDTPPPAQRDLTESRVVGSMLLGAVATVVFYLIFVHGIFRGTYFAEAFAQRGLIPYLTTFLAGTGLFLLLFGFLRIRREERTFEGIRATFAQFDALEQETAGELLDPLRELRRERGGHIVANRFLRAVHSVGEGIKSKSHLGDLLRDLGDFDLAIVQAAHLPVKYIIWLIPVLGFTGTVLGISAAISGFSELMQQAADFSAARGNLGEVALNLGVAFETTLLALIKTAILMYAFSMLQKRERSFFIQVDEYCADDVLQRVVPLQKPEQASEMLRLTAAIEVLSASLIHWDPKFDAALDRLFGRLDGLADDTSANLGARIAEAIGTLGAQVSEANTVLRARIDEFGGYCDAIALTGEQVAARHAAAAETVAAAATRFGDGAAAAAETVAAAATRFGDGADRIDAAQAQLNANVEALTRLEEFSRCLDALRVSTDQLPLAVRELARPREITLVERTVAGRPPAPRRPRRGEGAPLRGPTESERLPAPTEPPAPPPEEDTDAPADVFMLDGDL